MCLGSDNTKYQRNIAIATDNPKQKKVAIAADTKRFFTSYSNTQTHAVIGVLNSTLIYVFIYLQSISA